MTGGSRPVEERGRCARGAVDLERDPVVIDGFDDVLARARDGSGEAFTEIWTDLSRPVAAYLRSRGVDEVDGVSAEHRPQVTPPVTPPVGGPNAGGAGAEG